MVEKFAVIGLGFIGHGIAKKLAERGAEVLAIDNDPDKVDAIKDDVIKIIDSDPRIKADTVIITPFESGLQIEVELQYLKYNVSEKLRLTFDENNGLLN